MYVFGFVVCVIIIHHIEAQIWPPERRGYPMSSYGDPYPEQEYPAASPYLEAPYSNYPPIISPTGSPFQRRPVGFGVGVAPTGYGGQMGLPMMGGGIGGMAPLGSRAQEVAVASLMNYVTDKDNFQPQGCSWDGGRNRCTDVLNQCKGICRDFANDVVTHDCRCVPFGYAALLGWQS